MLWNFLNVKFQEKFDQHKFNNNILDLMDALLVIIDRGDIDNRTIQVFDSIRNRPL
jgi:hypothetical protein